jgi:prepilin-type processing-associated H-X9-DG protein
MPNQRRRAAWFFTITIVILVLGFCTLQPWNWENNWETAGLVKSISNLRQISDSLARYTHDFQGQYPDSFRTLLLNEPIKSDVFISPLRNETSAQGPTTQAVADQLTNGGHLSYVYLGKGLSTETVTPDTIVAYELMSDNIRTKLASFLYGDGHVEYQDATYYKNILAAAASGKFPVIFSNSFADTRKE